MTRKEFIRRCKYIKRNWLDKDFEDHIRNVLDSGCMDIENLPDNYSGVYPVIAAILKDVARQCIIDKETRRQVNNIKLFI